MNRTGQYFEPSAIELARSAEAPQEATVYIDAGELLG
jgi:hypothetical protein